MTASLLLAWIFAALLLQTAAGIAITVWRRRTPATTAANVALSASRSPDPAPVAWQGWRDFRVLRRVFEDDAGTQCSFYLAPVDGAALPPFKPGQFLTFSLQPGGGSKPADTRAITRCYSLSDRPEAGTYRVTIKRVPAPSSRPELPPGEGSGHFHDQVQEGSILKVKAPSGKFFLDPHPDLPAVLIAGGIGITPLMSMLRWCLAEQPARTIHLFYGLRCGTEHAFKLQLEQLAQSHPQLRLHTAYSQPGPGDVQGRDFQHTGNITLELLRNSLPHGRHQFYICGPAPMMESLVPAIAGWGVPPADIHFEAFGPASVALTPEPAGHSQPLPAAPLEVQFVRAGRTLSWDGQDANLLEFAERQGLAIEAGCRAGSCGSCETKLLSGDVRYPHPPDYAIAPGHCLLCVGTPASALVLEA
jgi:ferredoxin-NADP reductase